MAYELREGQGSLFKNKHKTADNHPNARGDLLLDGVLYEVSAWTKKTKLGEPWQSLQVRRKEPRAPAEAIWGSEVGPINPDDDVPF